MDSICSAASISPKISSFADADNVGTTQDHTHMPQKAIHTKILSSEIELTFGLISIDSVLAREGCMGAKLSIITCAWQQEESCSDLRFTGC